MRFEYLGSTTTSIICLMMSVGCCFLGGWHDGAIKGGFPSREPWAACGSESGGEVAWGELAMGLVE